MAVDIAREPLAIRGAVILLAQMAITLAVSFGLGWSANQIAGVMGFVSAAGTFVVVLWTRGKVTPVDDPRDADGRPLTSRLEQEEEQ